ncbi:MAG: S1 family peptidase [Ilumatobacteraceae bacterium]
MRTARRMASVVVVPALVAAGACDGHDGREGSDGRDVGAGVPIAVVQVAATPCDRPTARLGTGAVVGAGLVITAAHVVEDDLRELLVDGRPATVVALDTRTDSAVVAVAAGATSTGGVAWAEAEATGTVQVLTSAGTVATTVERVVRLEVEDATDEAVHHRLALVLDGALAGGASGSPVVDADGGMVGMVTVAHAGRDVTYATAASELSALLEAARDAGDTSAAAVPGNSVTGLSLAAADPCA